MGGKSGAQFSGARGQALPETPGAKFADAQLALETSVVDAARELAREKRAPAMKVLVDLMESKTTPAATRRACARDVLEYADSAKVGAAPRGARSRGLTIQIVNLVTGDPSEEKTVSPAVRQAVDQALELSQSEYLASVVDEEDTWEPTEQLPVPDFEPASSS